MHQTEEVPRFVSLKTTKHGDTFTLHCAATQKNRNTLYWYKQSPGYIPQMVAAKVYDLITIFPPFNSSFIAEKGEDFNLIIRYVNKEDEASYFCQEHYSNNWIGIVLFVNGKIHHLIFCFYIIRNTFSLKEPPIYLVSTF